MKGNLYKKISKEMFLRCAHGLTTLSFTTGSTIFRLASELLVKPKKIITRCTTVKYKPDARIRSRFRFMMECSHFHSLAAKSPSKKWTARQRKAPLVGSLGIAAIRVSSCLAPPIPGPD